MIARLLVLLLFVASPAWASYPEYRLPDDVQARRVDFLSEGTPLVGHIVQAKAKAGQRLPTVILCQGTGGLQHYHLAQAIAFARAGYTVMTFDYRGWGASRGRLIPVQSQTVEVRETVDAVEQTLDVLAAIAIAVAAPEVDAARLALWGTSLGATIALQATIYDGRIKAAVLQVGPYDLRRSGAFLDETRALATKRAQGELPYPAPQPRVQGQLHGHQVREKAQLMAPIEDLSRLGARRPAILIIDAGNEELFDIRQHGARLIDRLNDPKKRVVLPGLRHYGIYSGEGLRQAIQQSVDWLAAHL
jgi:alpha-beta hydrolase superfamily lysophospholipase